MMLIKLMASTRKSFLRPFHLVEVTIKWLCSAEKPVVDDVCYRVSKDQALDTRIGVWSG